MRLPSARGGITKRLGANNILFLVRRSGIGVINELVDDKREMNINMEIILSIDKECFSLKLKTIFVYVHY